MSKDSPFHREIARRRTFAIVSHPDAGKTTLTEKFLLYGGAVGLAGSVTARKNQRATTSDWMELEKKRGISISSTVLQFDYRSYRVNLLDTPGHKDFSEDTYRVLTAVDAAVMVIDAGKGIESQTRKLFEVCRQRGVPIFTFMNKLDRPTLDPLALLDELESVLGIAAYPMNWPLGTGPNFKGVWDRRTRMAHLYERTPGGAYRAPVSTAGLADPVVRDRLDERTYRTVCDEVEMLDGAGADFQGAEVLAGRTTPVYFGSALNNFGVQLLLDGFLEHSSPPTSRRNGAGTVEPTHPAFSGFVFKIQANMDPRHRDRVAFVRVVSGRFERDMTVTHARTGRAVRLSHAAKLFGRDRETVEEAYPGDVVGIVGNVPMAIGDTLTEDQGIVYDEIPRFAPECFAYLENPVPANFKRFRDGLDQLLQEGVVQLYDLPDSLRRVPLLGAVGPLQFEIVQYRLESEYGAASRLEGAPWTVTQWLGDGTDIGALTLPQGVRPATDSLGQRVLLFPDEWSLRYFRDKNSGVTLHDGPPRPSVTSTGSTP
ncbi:MAG TPA: peptide chain release factor 3 [Phycisphaerae bacterium]|nr:peptide chain release factor 3 [Phycisphaerae bacterium]HOI55814.1 peptide chain release factor 3 [Phycisphaerae bacterium]